MTGPEHYGYAEQLLDMAAGGELGSDIERYRLKKAEVHAILALAAATALKGGFWDETGTTHGRTLLSWADAAGREGGA